MDKVKRKIMIVEDDIIIRLFISKIITELDCEIVAEAGSSEKALLALTTEHPDIILMDIGIKGSMDGIETTHVINGLYQIPVIYITGNSDKSTLDKAEQTAPLGFIFKPIDEDGLKRRFNELCEKLDEE